MIKLEIKWLCDFLGISYTSESTIDVWETTICNYIKRGFCTVNYNITSTNKQLTIFDYD